MLYPCHCITMIQCKCLTLFVKRRQKFKLCNETVSIPPLDTMKTVVFWCNFTTCGNICNSEYRKKNQICNSNLWQQAKLENHWYQSQEVEYTNKFLQILFSNHTHIILANKCNFTGSIDSSGIKVKSTTKRQKWKDVIHKIWLQLLGIVLCVCDILTFNTNALPVFSSSLL